MSDRVAAGEGGPRTRGGRRQGPGRASRARVRETREGGDPPTAAPTRDVSAPWRSRIVGRGDVPPADLVAPCETWRAVTGLPYEVSDLGRVRRTGAGRGAAPGRLVATRLINTGYVRVALWVENRRTEHLVHRLVAAAFCDEGPAGAEVNHKDGDKLNNVAANLEWVTRSENIRHRVALRAAHAEVAA